MWDVWVDCHLQWLEDDEEGGCIENENRMQ
jgi:hypothetical protein